MNKLYSERLNEIKTRDRKIIEGTRLKMDFDWLIQQAEKVEKLKEEFESEIDFHKREKEGLKDLARSYHGQLLRCKCGKVLI